MRYFVRPLYVQQIKGLLGLVNYKNLFWELINGKLFTVWCHAAASKSEESGRFTRYFPHSGYEAQGL